MNKDDYIKEMSEIKAPQKLKEKILNDKYNNRKIKKKKNVLRYLAVAAACVVLVGGLMPLVSYLTTAVAKSTDKVSYYAADDGNADYAAPVEESIGESASASSNSSYSVKTNSERKITKNAELTVQTKNLSEFIDSLNKKTEELEGYNESVNVGDYSSGYAQIQVRIPADNLDAFIAAVDEMATVKSRNVTLQDITDSYTDVESHIKALETEVNALLGILEKCQTVAETIEVQDRLAQVRGELDSLKSQKQNYDSQISYSAVSISVSEEERIVKSDKSFSSRLKAKFEDSLYNIGNFFEELAVNLFGGILYILIAAAAVAVLVFVIKAIRRKKS